MTTAKGPSVKRYYVHRSHPRLTVWFPMAHEAMVLASDYDTLHAECERLKGKLEEQKAEQQERRSNLIEYFDEQLASVQATNKDLQRQLEEATTKRDQVQKAFDTMSQEQFLTWCHYNMRPVSLLRR